MAWLTDEYERLTGRNAPGAFTGKPLSLGGSLGRSRATAYGGYLALWRLYERKDTTLQGATVAIQ